MVAILLLLILFILCGIFILLLLTFKKIVPTNEASAIILSARLMRAIQGEAQASKDINNKDQLNNNVDDSIIQ